MGATVEAGAVLAVAEAAGRAIMDVYDRPARATEKADGSPLTEADLAANETIAAGLGALSPLPILSEESAAIPFEQRSAWKAYWLVDPLDGTREFLQHNGEFTVNIALIEDGRPILGVVVAPALGTAYWAARGRGAFTARTGRPGEAIRVARVAEDPLRVAASRSHGGEALPGFLARLGPHTLVPMGSSLKLCLVAEGRADLYPRLGPTSEWDIAAAQCVLEEAGGSVTAVDGTPLAYNKADILNPWFIAAGSESARQTALAAAGEVVA